MMRLVSTDQLLRDFSYEDFAELASFGAISAKTTQRLLQQGKIIQLESGEELYHEGAKVREFYIILSGQVSVFHLYKNMPARTRCYGPGEQIGFVSMIALHDRKGSAAADETSYLLQVSVDQFFELRESAPQDFGLLTLNLAREMARTIVRLGDRIAELTSQSPSKPEH